MKALKKQGFTGFNALRIPRFQPDYSDEVSEDYLDKLRKTIEEKKPDGFNLTPVCPPGW